MKIAQVTPGILPIPPKGWGAIEKLIWELHCNFLKEGHDSKIVYLDELTGDEDIVHIHVGNLANLAHERGIPYYFTMSDHHAYLYGKDYHIFKTNMTAMKNSIRTFVGGKYLVDYFEGVPEYSPYGVNTDYFAPPTVKPTEHRLLCVANNGYQHNPSEDRKGFGIAIAAAKRLGLPITVAGPKNNQLYFDNNPVEYDKLTIRYDLSEEELLEAYHTHTIFLHPSELEAGHPNLTLTEAMACGLPVVGTFEPNNSLNGMIIVTRDVDEVTAGIERIISNYDEYSTTARQQAEQLSWSNQAKEFLTIYEADRSATMKEQLIKHYKKTVRTPRVGTPVVKIHNVDGLFVEIVGGPVTQYNIKCIDKSTNEVVYETTVNNNSWVKPSKKYFVDWRVEIQDINSSYTYTHDLNLAWQRVYISLESKSLGDTLAWIPYAEEFRKKHNCTLICSTFFNKLFTEQYPEIQFVEPSEMVHELAALYRIGLFYTEDSQLDYNLHPSNPLVKPLQQISSDILGLPYREIRPQVKQPQVQKDSNLVTIGFHSTTQAKYWNNPTGWQEVVDYLKSKGYTVKLLSNEHDGYMGNSHPKGIEHHPASSLESVMEELKKSVLFIGLGSGLSWVSWALNVPTMIISGFSEPISEMKECIRITAPKGSCSGCFNRVRLDAGDWHWCPDHKNTPRHYECSKNITGQTVIDELEKFFNKTDSDIPGWFSYEELYNDVVDSAVGGETFVEIGAWLGKSTNHMARKITDSKKPIQFTTIDTWKGTDDEQSHQEVVSGYGGDIFPEFIKNTVKSNNHRTFNLIKDTSRNAANQFTNNSIDFIMIDAGHSYDALMDDLLTWYNKVKAGGIISGDDYTVFEGVTRAADEFFYGQFERKGYSFIRRKPRIQIKHMLTRPDDLREIVSAESIKQLQKYGMDYQPIINEVYEGLPPKEMCRRPDDIDSTPGEFQNNRGLGKITGRHYGCYLAHRNAVASMDDINYDYTLIFEADAYLSVGVEEFVNIVHKACFISERDNVYHISFANNPSGAKDTVDGLFSKTAHHQDLAHCYLVANRHKNWWNARIQDCEWDVGDLWFNHIFCHHPQLRYTTNKVYSRQADGYSLLDRTVKTW